jgi:uroporphyrinogen decarboxylase
MTGRRRILAALRGEPADRTPVMLHNFLMAAREAGVSMARYRRDGRAAAECFIRAVETYGYDGVVVDISTAMLAEALGIPIDRPDDLPSRCRAPLLADLAEARRRPPPSLRGAREIETALEAVAILKARLGEDVAVRGNCDQAPFSLASQLRGLGPWMMDLVEAEPGPIREVLDYAAGAVEAFMGLMAEAGADVLSNGDSPAGTAMISPAMYLAWAQPWERQMAGRAHALGRPYILHICGAAGPILAGMASTGADGLELDQMTEAGPARAVLGGRTAFIGNIDPSAVLALGTPAEVERATRLLLEAFRGEPRFILNAGCAIPAETPSANLKAMLLAARG